MADPIAQTKSDLLYTQVFTPGDQSQSAFTGYAKSVSGINTEGNFDILPQHANFVTLIRDLITIVDERGQKREFKVEKGLLEASNNLVKIFIEF